MQVAAYQAPLAACNRTDAIALIREQIHRCESLGVEILCCPEAVLGGLADSAVSPASIAIDRDALDVVLAPLASARVTTILGLTEIDRAGRLYNAAAVLHRGVVSGLYRKLHPAIRRSVYAAGHATPVFTVGTLTFGIVICRDSTFAEPVRVMASQGAAALFVPTNNGLPPAKASENIADDARRCDIAHAIEHGISVIRADVVGHTPALVSYGSSGIVDRDGAVMASAPRLQSTLIVADIATIPRPHHVHRP